MTISNKDKKLLVYLIAVGLVALVYFFVTKPKMDKQQELATEIENIKSQVNHYNDIYIHQEEYENQIAEAQVQYNESLNKFFGGLNQENTLMNIKGIEEATNTWIFRVTFQEYQTAFGESVGTETEVVEGEAVESTETANINTNSLKGTRQDLSLDYSCKYNDYKRFIEYLQNYDKRVFIASINSRYDANSDEVSGTMVLSQFAIESPDIEYSAPDLSNVPLGVDNIFTVLKSETELDESLDNSEDEFIGENDENSEDEDNSDESQDTPDEDNESDNNEDIDNDTPQEPADTGNEGRRPRPE